MSGFSTRIGIIGFIVVLIIVLSTVFVSAQSPAVTTTTTTTPTTATITITKTPTVTPAFTNFTVDLTKTGDDKTNNTADVKLSVKLNDVDLRTQTPTGTPPRPVGLIKYSYDMTGATPSASAAASPAISPAASPAASAAATGTKPVVPTATADKIQALQAMSLLSTATSFTFTSVPAGEHTFAVEVVNQDGTPMSPRLYFEVKTNVIPR